MRNKVSMRHATLLLTFTEEAEEACWSDPTARARRRLLKRLGGQEMESEGAGRLEDANRAAGSADLEGARVAQGRRDSVAGAAIGSGRRHTADGVELN
jgi:hypothetical protein